MIYSISTPDKVAWIYNEIKDFCRKANIGYTASQLAASLRTMLYQNNPLFRVRIYKSSKESGNIEGFSVYYIENDLIDNKCFVQCFYAPKNEQAKKELAEDIVDWAKKQNLKSIIYITAHKPEWMIERFDMIEVSKGFKLTRYILEKELEE